MNCIQYVLLDFDGTIADTSKGIFHCINYAMEKLGKQKFSPEVLRKFIGPPLTESFKDFAYLSETEIWNAVKLFRSEYLVQGQYMTHIYAGIPEFINAVHKTNRKIAVATSKPYIQAVTILKEKKLIDKFDYVAGITLEKQNETKTDVIKKAMKAFNTTDYKSAVMIGDRKYDIEAGNNLGMKTIAVQWGFGNQTEFETAKCSYIVDKPEDLINTINTL